MLSEDLMNRIKSRTLTEPDCTELDIRLSEDLNLYMLELDDLCYVIGALKRSLGELSLLVMAISAAIEMAELDMMICITEEDVPKYERILVLAKYMNEREKNIAMLLGNYYYNLIDEESSKRALELYREAFESGLPVTLVGYWESVECYADLLGKEEAIKELDRLLGIDYHLSEVMIDIDYVNVHLIRLGMLEYTDPRYLPLLDEAIECAEIMVENARGNKSMDYFHTTDEEGALCELLSRRLEYFVEKRDYPTAMATYHELTDEIGRSDAVRFYAFRDHVYKRMLEYMTPEHPEISFVTSLLRGDVLTSEELNRKKSFTGRVITLYREGGEHFDFDIKSVFADRVTAYPILPVVGEGGPMFFRLEAKDGKYYLVKE